MLREGSLQALIVSPSEALTGYLTRLAVGHLLTSIPATNCPTQYGLIKMEFHEHFHYSQTKPASNPDRYLKFYIQFNGGVQFGQFYNQRPSKMR